jgi:serine phosphatase RsbU (regulator of sigma subunit)/putative methionine-R-sulfoxide reductase with GAF domain
MVVQQYFLTHILIQSDTSSLLGFGVVVLGLLLLIGCAAWFIRRRAARYRADSQPSELASLSSLGNAISVAPLEPEELAEVAYIEAARILETDFFQLGVFEGDTYRTLLWVQDNQRVDNQIFTLETQNKGVTGWIRDSRRPLLVSDFETERESLPALPSYQSSDPPRAGIFMPLIVEDDVIGLISIQNRRPGAFSQNHLYLLNILANYLAPSLTLTSVQHEIEQFTLQNILLQETSRRLISLQPLGERLEQVAPIILQALDYQAINIYEYLEGNLTLRASASYSEAAPGEELHPISPVVQRAVDEGRTLLEDPEELLEPPTLEHRTEIAIPLKVEDRVLGILDIHYVSGERLPPKHLALTEMLASQIAIAILEARNYSIQQEEAWITTVLLEVARHAAQPGDPEIALQAVLQLVSLLTDVRWSVLLLPSDRDDLLRVGPITGLRRQKQEAIRTIRISPKELDILPPYSDDGSFQHVPLPAALIELLQSQEALAIILSDASSLLGILLLEGQELSGRRLSLLVGIARQISLRLENTRLIEEAAVRRSLENELAMARDIQASFLPDSLPTHSDWEIGIQWTAAREVGGDFYDIIILPEGPHGPRWGIVIADVADKGIPAALYMALCRTLIKTVAMSRIDPGQTLQRVNNLLFADSNADLFVSVFYGVLEPEIGMLTYANAGHNPPLLFAPEQPAHQLREHGMVLGVQMDEVYSNFSLTVEPGQLLVWYTDGVTEAQRDAKELFGLHRLENLVLGLKTWQAQLVADKIASRVSSFTGSPFLSDDMTVVTLRNVK